ncbi:MAG: hypothetical protein WBA54_06240 [Acidaminobacteraceae bacterium]
MMFIIWILIAYLVYQFAVKNNVNISSNKNLFSSNENSAEQILKSRYANSEIDEETYKKMMKNISR